jgi:hypothetical protein
MQGASRTVGPRRAATCKLVVALAWLAGQATALSAQAPTGGVVSRAQSGALTRLEPQFVMVAGEATPAGTERAGGVQEAGGNGRSPALFLASAVVPGAAQFLMGDDRWVPYAAVEVWALISYVQQRRLGRSLEARYRDVAWQVARRVSVGERRDTVFEYYEAMIYYPSSGGWMPDGFPEQQAGTFNGELWRLATALYFPGGRPAAPGSPDYEAAVRFYLSRAVPPGYAWAWGSAALEQQVFADLISESDAAFRSATRYVGVILANHMASAVEALITSRLRQMSGDALRLETGPSRPGNPGGWDYGVRIQF